MSLPDDFSRAVFGQMPGPDPVALERTAEVRDRWDIISSAVSAMVYANNTTTWDRPKDWQSADDIVRTELQRLGYDVNEAGGGEDAVVWSEMLNIAITLAKSRPTYYGVHDPEKEWYCPICRKAKPIEEFPGFRGPEHLGTKSPRCEECA